jgi:hypothetical protein
MSLATSLDAPVSAVTRSAKASKATSRRSSQVSEKPRKVSFYLSPEAIRRLGVAASMLDTDKSKVLETVLQSSPVLKRFVVSDRSKADADAPSIGESGASA